MASISWGPSPEGRGSDAAATGRSEEEELLDIEVDGDELRFMWDYGVVVPLWDAAALLPEDPRWLRHVLGLSDGLIEELTSWGDAMCDLDTRPLPGREAYDELDERAQELVERLRREVEPRFTVTYDPW